MLLFYFIQADSMTMARDRFVPLALAFLFVLLAGAAGAALVRPYPGYGNFPMTVDVAYRWHDDGTLDLDVMVEVRSGHLLFIRPTHDLPFRADLDVTVRLEGVDGAVHEIVRHQVIRELTLENAVSLERVNNFTFTLEDVKSPSGDLGVKVVDRHQERKGPRAWREHPRAFSEMYCYWVAPIPPGEFEGFSLGDPLFLRGYAEVDLMGRRILRNVDDTYATMLRHIHLARQYGLRQQHLQFACEIYPPDAERAAILDHDGLLVQIISRELRFAANDTVVFDDVQKTRLGLGESVIIFHEIDVESLPPGAYLLSLAPLDGKGRPWVTEFDVVWSLGVPRRRGDEELALARLLLDPEQVAVFKGADSVRRQDMMDAFWDPLDPETETPQNEAWIEFQERVGYVRQHLGGFGLDGSMDPRAEVYLRMGTPSRIVFEKDTSNEALRTDPNQDTWTDFRGFVDTRQGVALPTSGGTSPSVSVAKVGSPFDASTQQSSGQSGGGGLIRGPTTGRFPNSRTGAQMSSKLHRLARYSKGNSGFGEPVSETWFYAHGGFPLFAHAWSDTTPRGFQFGYTADKGAYDLRWTRELEPEVFGVIETRPSRQAEDDSRE